MKRPLYSASIWVPGLPQTKGNHRWDQRRRRLYDQNQDEIAAWEDRIRLFIRGEGIAPAAPLKGPMSVSLLFRLKRPRSVRRRYPIKRGKNAGDVDKLERAVYDAMAKLIYVDDSQIVDAPTKKRYEEAQGPGVFIEIEEMEDE